ncbi:DUF3034 family protein [Hahella ganghwensis]|uniref:DUF3034 family protein n=1 Tax=Hahella ganghwensis TaxID=286420 RepID=UPI0006857F11|nr:DUF3034 family protein [Hahella ganghwensis]
MCRTAVHFFLLCCAATGVQAGEGKLLGTPGVTQLEGSGGGGIVPWATMAGYASRDETAISGFATRVNVDDYRLSVWGAAINLYDRVEVSFAHQNFYLKGAGSEIRQDIAGLKVRLSGDLVYTDWPQISAGIQHKMLADDTIADAVGAKDSNHGTDLYVVASKLHLGAIGGYNALWSLAGRATKANQLGLLGYGGDDKDSYSLNLEASVAVLLSRQWALGAEYRQKPDNLSFAEEQDWMDLFVAYLPNKHINATLAYADLGDIAGADHQTGVYLSITGYFW